MVYPLFREMGVADCPTVFRKELFAGAHIEKNKKMGITR